MMGSDSADRSAASPKTNASSVRAPENLEAIYRDRFSLAQRRSKDHLWSVLCARVFQRYVAPDDVVVDLAAGTCDFINRIEAGRRIAVDLNPETKIAAAAGVEVLNTAAERLALDTSSVDVVFTSNFFEHLPNTDALLEVLAECHRVLKPGGQIIVLMPNLRYVRERYWDFLDHHLPLTHKSLSEGLTLAGFTVTRVVPRFLPYTVKQVRFAVPKAVIHTYVSLPILWRVLGKQMLLIAEADAR